MPKVKKIVILIILMLSICTLLALEIYEHSKKYKYIYIPYKSFDKNGHDFYIKETEVTQYEWQQLMGYNPSLFKNCGEECPVENVSFFDVLEYLNKLSKTENIEECYILEDCKKNEKFMCNLEKSEDLCLERSYCKNVIWKKDCLGYRLPNEKEWNFSANYDAIKVEESYSLETEGERSSKILDKISIYGGNSGVSYYGGYDCSSWKEKQYISSTCGTKKVKSKTPNRYGLYDMIGNVEEWVWDSSNVSNLKDFYIKNDYSVNIKTKGCSWGFEARFCYITNFSETVAFSRGPSLGFRPVKNKHRL